MEGSVDPSLIPTEPLSREVRVFLGLFVLTQVLIPILFIEAFPFSRFWLFADRPQEETRYFVFDTQGRRVPEAFLKLHSLHTGAYPHRRFGQTLGPSLHEYGKIEDLAKLRAQLQELMLQNPGLPSPLRIQRVRYHPGAMGGFQISPDPVFEISRE